MQKNMLSHWVVMVLNGNASSNANVLIRTYGPHCSYVLQNVNTCPEPVSLIGADPSHAVP